MAVTYHLNIDQEGRGFPHYWELCIGSCHAATILREDVREHIRKAHRDCGFRYLRFHGLFDDDMSVVVSPMLPFGEPTINFFNIDSIFDFLLDTGMKPFVELGFMPEAFASGKQTCMHYRGNVTMPKNDAVWSDFIKTFAEHLIARYGKDEVESWYFEVWNEPNLNFFFDGTQEDYFHLYDMTARALKSVDETLRVGGPATSNNMWIPEFIGFCKENGTPLDFITTHHYPHDDPLSRQGMNGPGTKGQGFDEAAKEQLMALPREQLEALIQSMFSNGTQNERDILERLTRKAKEEAGHYPLIYTEWNGSMEYDTSYQAAFVAHTLAHNEGLVEGYSFWCVSDIFEEMGLKGLPFNDAFGIQTVHGIAKPSYRLFEALHSAGEHRLSVEGEAHRTAEILALAGETEVTVFVYNHDIDRRDISAEEIVLELSGNYNGVRMAVIDGEHCNPLAAWEAQGKPEYPTRAQLAQIEAASKLVYQETAPDDKGTLRITAQPESVTILKIKRA